MSAKAVTEFLAKMAEDPALRDEVFAAVKEAEDRLAVTGKIARERGYEFEDEELKKILDVAQGTTPGELTEEELEAVAAGQLVFQQIMFAPPYVPVGPGIIQRIRDQRLEP
jgi:predicted ribosomally synthesized peptide with nif11-like leader